MTWLKEQMKIVNLSGWTAMLFLQFAPVPVIWAYFVGGSTKFPPATLVFMIWFGLLLNLIRSVLQRDLVFSVSNGVGFFFQSIMYGLMLLA